MSADSIPLGRSFTDCIFYLASVFLAFHLGYDIVNCSVLPQPANKNHLTLSNEIYLSLWIFSSLFLFYVRWVILFWYFTDVRIFVWVSFFLCSKLGTQFLLNVDVNRLSDFIVSQTSYSRYLYVQICIVRTKGLCCCCYCCYGVSLFAHYLTVHYIVYKNCIYCLPVNLLL